VCRFFLSRFLQGQIAKKKLKPISVYETLIKKQVDRQARTMPYMMSKTDKYRDYIALLEQKVDNIKGLSNNLGNLFYDLPQELQTKIHFINVIDELPFSLAFSRKKQYLEMVKMKGKTSRIPFTQMLYRSNGTMRKDLWNEYPRALTLRTPSTHIWIELKKGQLELELDDVCLCSTSYLDAFKKPAKLGKKDLQQMCEDNGLKWFKSWTTKRLNKELMTI
jgi:hypothetical protein